MPESYKSGEQSEIDFSLDFHQEGLPVLVSPQLLRSRNCGQVDFARMIKKKNGEKYLEVVELKSRSFPSLSQKKRVGYSADYLSRLLDLPVRVNYKRLGGDQFF